MLRRTLALAILLSAFSGKHARADDHPPVIAVFEIEDATKRPKKLPAALTDYFRVKLAETRVVKVVDKGDQEQQLKKLIKAERKSSYKTCVDESCQIPLGKELAADKILRAKITRFGRSFVLAAELIDLASGASAGAASDKNDGTEEGLMASVENIAKQLTGDLRAKADADRAEAARAREDAEKAQLLAQKNDAAVKPKLDPVPHPATTAQVTVDDGPTGLELSMIIGGWSIFGVAYLGEILINLLANDINSAYYSFFPVAGPLFIEYLNKTVPGYEANPINYISAGAQALGAGVAVLGHVLAATHDKKPAPQASLTGPGGLVEVHLVFGPGHLGLAGTF